MSYLIELYGEPANSFWMDFFMGFFLETLFAYFFCLRCSVKSFFVSKLPSKFAHLSRKQRKIEEKREKNRRKKIKDRPKLKEQFIAWLLCRCYKDEQKNRGFKFFVFLNYLYLFLSAVYFVLALVALFIPSFRYDFQVLLRMKFVHVDLFLFLSFFFGTNIMLRWKSRMSK